MGHSFCVYDKIKTLRVTIQFQISLSIISNVILQSPVILYYW